MTLVLHLLLLVVVRPALLLLAVRRWASVRLHQLWTLLCALSGQQLLS